jgi:hypothetical protein
VKCAVAGVGRGAAQFYRAVVDVKTACNRVGGAQLERAATATIEKKAPGARNHVAETQSAAVGDVNFRGESRVVIRYRADDEVGSARAEACDRTVGTGVAALTSDIDGVGNGVGLGGTCSELEFGKKRVAGAAYVDRARAGSGAGIAQDHVDDEDAEDYVAGMKMPQFIERVLIIAGNSSISPQDKLRRILKMSFNAKRNLEGHEDEEQNDADEKGELLKGMIKQGMIPKGSTGASHYGGTREKR